MRRDISDTWLRSLEPRKGERIEVWDSKVPLLVLRISTRAATWSIRQRLPDGRRSQPTLGRWPAMGIQAARKAAQGMLVDIARGADPVTERRAKRAEREARAALPTVNERMAEWQQAKESQWSHRYQQEVRRLCDKEIARKLGKRALIDTTRSDWTGLIAAVHRRAPGVGAMLYRTVAAFLGHAEAHGWIPLPLLPRKGAALIAPPGEARERILTDTELKAIWGATDAMSAKTRCFARLLILTGCREMEAADISIGEVALQTGRWAINGSRTKNGRGYVVPLNDTLISDVRAIMPAHDAGPGWKLLGGIAGSGLRGFSPIKRKLDKLSGVTGWRWHDLRRTCRSGLSALGIAPDIAERALNHISHASQLQRTYDRHGYEGEILTALRRWQGHVESLASDSARGTQIVPLRASA
jgi:integrase